MRAAVAFCAALAAAPAFAQVTPSGATATMATTNADGSITVGIAPPSGVNGTSLNRYTDFNVHAAGVALDNSIGTPARTIINEVTSANPSRLEGPLSVIGNRAHVIVANPNGITANGGSFINTGAVALTTGTVTSAGTATARLDVNAGDLVIGPQGLAGTFSHLELFAKTITINGPLTNDTPGATTKIVAGESTVTVSNAVAPGDSAPSYSGVVDGGAATTGVSLDVTRAGLIRGGRILVAVTDDGGGVRNAGGFAAEQGDFLLTSDGYVTFEQGSATATGMASILALDGDVANLGGLVEAEEVDVVASGDIINQAEGSQAIMFARGADLEMIAGGDIVNDQGRLLSNDDVDLIAGGTISNIIQTTGATDGTSTTTTSTRKGRRSWASLWLVRDEVEVIEQKFGEERVPGADALIFGANDTNLVASRIENLGGEITANAGDLTVVSTGEVDNQAYAVGTSTIERRCNWLFCSDHATSSAELKGGLMNAGGDMSVVAPGGFNNGAGVLTSVGDMEIVAPTITNTSKSVALLTSAQRGALDLWAHRVASARFERGGSYLAGGTITFNGPAAVDLQGGILDAGGGLIGAPAVNGGERDSLEIDLSPLEPVSAYRKLF